MLRIEPCIDKKAAVAESHADNFIGHGISRLIRIGRWV
jgi:hypothetical protein